MLKVGLTGGIGSGKSTVSKQLAGYGAAVVDADLIAREVVEPGTPGLAAVVLEFGDGVLTAEGALDREALGRLVFGHDDRRKALSGILHPLIGTRSGELWAEAEAAGAAVLVHDVPLLVESHLEAMYDEIVVVDVPVDRQLRRLVELRGMTPEDAQARISSQASRKTRLAAATKVLDNSGSLEQLTQQVADLWESLTQR